MFDIPPPPQRSNKQFACAVISFACPFVAVATVLVYQSVAYGEFWHHIVPGEDDAASALMAVGEVIQIALSVFVGSAVGIIFAGLSLWSKPRSIRLGLAAILFNAVPFILLLFFYARI